MVKKDQVPVKVAAAAVKAQPDPDEQAKWVTPKDVKRAAQNGTAKPVAQNAKPKAPEPKVVPLEQYEALKAQAAEAEEELAQLRAELALLKAGKPEPSSSADELAQIVADAAKDLKNALV